MSYINLLSSYPKGLGIRFKKGKRLGITQNTDDVRIVTCTSRELMGRNHQEKDQDSFRMHIGLGVPDPNLATSMYL